MRQVAASSLCRSGFWGHLAFSNYSDTEILVQQVSGALDVIVSFLIIRILQTDGWKDVAEAML